MNEEDKNIDQAPQTKAPAETPAETPSNEEAVPNTLQGNAPQQSSSGPLVGVAIIIIVLIVGGIYFWSTAVDRDKETRQLPTIQSGGETDAIVNQLNTQGISDEVADIEADLNLTDLENLDSELDDLLNEL